MAQGRVLVVDDEPMVTEVVGRYLQREGFEVSLASDGEEALQRARADNPDLILLDLQMPLRNGYEVLGELRQDPRYAALPIIALTASAMQGDREKALEAGFTGYLTKPVRLGQLRDEVQQLLESRNSGNAD